MDNESEVSKLLEIIKLYEKALQFYASEKHIKKYIPEYLKYAMMSENSSRYVEEIVDRGEVAREVLKNVGEIK